MSVKSRSYFSVPYLCGAAMFAREAYKTESTYDGTSDGELALTHRARVVSAITSSAAALEAMINEAFEDAAEADGSCVATVPADTRAMMAALWDRGIPGAAILDKFDIAHLVITGGGLDKSHNRWGNVLWVVRLRNNFIHFKPSWQTHNTINAPATPVPSKGFERYERALKGRFAENQICGAGNPYYPDKLLGHGCAEWSIKSVLDFADHFWQSIGVVPVYDSYRHLLTTR
jgi:hypothetical protein